MVVVLHKYHCCLLQNLGQELTVFIKMFHTIVITLAHVKLNQVRN